ncbi:hypothetical protein ACEN4P_04635 [Marinilactibacillus psychrotolerans]|uniref:DUF4083 domain-containing protein n=2 Tax=Marinilactibacillus psychrotolerans TaxID=191770 RepID=A0AAV3WU80_9LACT|nr:hypothetical protein [Marinilactibacillus psychrotolerans]SDC82462.1 hypothetical protein SAMN04488013_11022 [Marinilactibacillus psychrotolerans]SJN31194.1 hypothetical protein FM115_05395 [Marinilactibacillus psychrotolerans 42ea]GEL66602.1 hypothetical protein MPS01_07570 [Marinilactibacillus psychrotolerans]GEQ32884.1 hypothetical protein B795N_07660 [Marinilactibacillus psychrotolerans]GEQ35124.1 hypothetical protein M132T_06320 [Marinilactibacillus psychrotolerans]
MIFISLFMIVLYLAVPAAIIFFLKLCYDMVSLTKEKNVKLDRLIGLLEKREQKNE